MQKAWIMGRGRTSGDLRERDQERGEMRARERDTRARAGGASGRAKASEGQSRARERQVERQTVLTQAMTSKGPRIMPHGEVQVRN